MRKKRPGGYLPMKNLILRTLAVTGVVSVALIAPKLLPLIKKLDRPATRRKNFYRNILSMNKLLVQSGTGKIYENYKITVILFSNQISPVLRSLVVFVLVPYLSSIP